MVFVMRQLDRLPKTLGEKLRALRRGQAVSLIMMEEETHIQKRYLEALEHGWYDVLPEPLYTRNFIRAYARALGADETYFLELYAEESGQTDLLTPHRLPRQRVASSWFFVPANALKVISIGLCSAVVLGYFGYQIYGMLRAPSIVIDYPVDGAKSDSALVEVRGHVENPDVSLLVNGQSVVVNEDRAFAATVDLSRGLNVITVQGARRYSQTATEYLRVVFDETTVGEKQGISFVSQGLE